MPVALGAPVAPCAPAGDLERGCWRRNENERSDEKKEDERERNTRSFSFFLFLSDTETQTHKMIIENRRNNEEQVCVILSSDRSIEVPLCLKEKKKSNVSLCIRRACVMAPSGEARLAVSTAADVKLVENCQNWLKNGCYWLETDWETAGRFLFWFLVFSEQQTAKIILKT